MKTTFKSIAISTLAALLLQQAAEAARTNTRRKSPTQAATTPTEQTKEDCATKYMAALDKECYNSGTIFSGGVYADCSDRSIPDLYSAMDMQLEKVVGRENFAKAFSDCSAYRGYALEKWMSAKKVIETSAVKGSSECALAMGKLTAAKKCYSSALAHDGNFFEFETLMKRSCGEYPDVAQKFAKAGDLGFANIPRLLENYSTLQFTNKAENWRSAVEATLMNYIYSAQHYCGDADYELATFNQFYPDSRENLLTTAKEGFADQFGRDLGIRAQGALVSSSPSSVIAVGSAKKGDKLYQAMGWKAGVANSEANHGYATTASAPYKLGNVYTIENAANLGTARARLVAIVVNGDVGTAASQDSLDRNIITSLGGRAGSDIGIYNIISAMADGDTFIIKQAGGLCQALRLKDKSLSKLTNAEADAMPALYSYLNDCEELVE